MNKINSRRVRYAGWFFLLLYIALVVSGRWMQYAAGLSPSWEDLVNDAAFILWPAMGVILISQRPDNPISWLFSIVAILYGLDEFTFGYAYYGTYESSVSLPGVQLAILFVYWFGRALTLPVITILFSLFPTGRPLSPAWGSVIWFGFSALVLYLFSAPLAPLDFIDANQYFPPPISPGADIRGIFKWVTLLSYAGMILSTFASIISLGVRFIHSNGVERQQLKWFVYSAVLFLPGLVALLIGESTGFEWLSVSGILLLSLVLIGISVASTIAILRYRLWDIDIIIRRTLQYAILTGLLALVYFGAVVLLQTLFGGLAGEANSPLVTVLSTLAIAALFNPLRLRIQEFIDRRFYRKKYDAERALAQFATSARDEVDVDRLAAALLDTVEETVQPDRAALWLHDPGVSR